MSASRKLWIYNRRSKVSDSGVSVGEGGGRGGGLLIQHPGLEGGKAKIAILQGAASNCQRISESLGVTSPQITCDNSRWAYWCGCGVLSALRKRVRWLLVNDTLLSTQNVKEDKWAWNSAITNEEEEMTLVCVCMCVHLRERERERVGDYRSTHIPSRYIPQ